MALVESVPIEGLSVYGVRQKSYAVEGVEGCDYVKAASIAMFREANAIEAETSAYAAVLEARQRKLDELGWALAVIVKANASMKTKKQKSTDLSAADADLKTASQILDKYRRDSNSDLKLPVNGDICPAACEPSEYYGGQKGGHPRLRRYRYDYGASYDPRGRPGGYGCGADGLPGRPDP